MVIEPLQVAPRHWFIPCLHGQFDLEDNGNGLREDRAELVKEVKRRFTRQDDIESLSGVVKASLAERFPAFLNGHVCAAEEAKLFAFRKPFSLSRGASQFSDQVGYAFHEPGTIAVAPATTSPIPTSYSSH